VPLAPQEDRTFFVTSVCFLRRPSCNPSPFAICLDVFKENRGKRRFQLHEFVIMRNHLHAILTPAPEVSLEKVRRGEQFIKGGFSYRGKTEMDCNFEIWQPGFKDHRIKDADDYRVHVEYIWDNPVQAGLVERAEDFPFSSAKLRNAVDEVPE
jgi:putative transposase